MNLRTALEGTLAIARAEALAASEKLIAEALAKEAEAENARQFIRYASAVLRAQRGRA